MVLMEKLKIFKTLSSGMDYGKLSFRRERRETWWIWPQSNFFFFLHLLSALINTLCDDFSENVNYEKKKLQINFFFPSSGMVNCRLVHHFAAYWLYYSLTFDSDILVEVLNLNNINHYMFAPIIDYLLVSVSYLLH